MSSELETNIVSVERVKEYSETPSEVTELSYFERKAGNSSKDRLSFLPITLIRHFPANDLLLSAHIFSANPYQLPCLSQR